MLLQYSSILLSQVRLFARFAVEFFVYHIVPIIYCTKCYILVTVCFV